MLQDLAELRETGSVKKLAERGVGFRKIQELVGLEDFQSFETQVRSKKKV
jgi:hypothetical protein